MIRVQSLPILESSQLLFLCTLKEIAWPIDTETIDYILTNTHFPELLKDILFNEEEAVGVGRMESFPPRQFYSGINYGTVMGGTETVSPSGIDKCLHGVRAHRRTWNRPWNAVHP